MLIMKEEYRGNFRTIEKSAFCLIYASPDGVLSDGGFLLLFRKQNKRTCQFTDAAVHSHLRSHITIHFLPSRVHRTYILGV
jgi:hypothetical protein